MVFLSGLCTMVLIQCRASALSAVNGKAFHELSLASVDNGNSKHAGDSGLQSAIVILHLVAYVLNMNSYPRTGAQKENTLASPF